MAYTSRPALCWAYRCTWWMSSNCTQL